MTDPCSDSQLAAFASGLLVMLAAWWLDTHKIIIRTKEPKKK